MRWGIRIATAAKAGAGHVARCRALVEALPGQVALFLDPDTTNFARFSELSLLTTSESSPESAGVLMAACQRGDVDAVLIDSYAMSETVISRLAKMVFTAVFRDTEVRGGENLSIDVNAPHSTVLGELCGLKFAPLPRGFPDLHKRATEMPHELGAPAKIMVSFGQRDSVNFTATALKALGLLEMPYAATIYLGSQAPHLSEIEARVRKMDGVDLVVAADALFETYLSYDLAVGAPGVSQMERACCGVPSILLSQNETQQRLIGFWEQTGAAITTVAKPVALKAIIEDCLMATDRLDRMRHCALTTIDGNGADRLAKVMQNLAEMVKP